MKTLWSMPLLLAVSATSGVATPQAPEVLAREALSAEKSLWQAEVDSDLDVVRDRLDAGFIQITTGQNGEIAVSKGRDAALAAIAKALEQGRFAGWHIDEPMTQVEGRTVVLSFRWTQTYVPHGSEPVRTRGIATSVWVKRAQGWKNVHFHWHVRAGQDDGARP